MNDGVIGNLPKNINDVVPNPTSDAKEISKLVKEDGRVIGYQLSDGETLTKDEAVDLAKENKIKGVAVAHRKDDEYLRSLPDDDDSNNLSQLPSVTAKALEDSTNS